MIVPTLCVGMQPGTLRVPEADAERPVRHSHAGAWERLDVETEIVPTLCVGMPLGDAPRPDRAG